MIALRRYAEARQELQRAFACLKGYGHAANPWNTWITLADLERATGHPDAAYDARQLAITTYRAYRRDGGRSRSDHIQIYAAAAQAISENQQNELAQKVNEFLGPDAGPTLATVVQRVKAILAGQCDPTLADDPDIHPIDAAELLILIDVLVEQESTTAGG